jgi:serine phosphatase RsbU (regulator of sigma subunit)
MDYLQILSGPTQGQRCVLDGKPTVVLGRAPHCDVVVNDPAVSRTHAQITVVQGKYYIEDLKSRNRTLVNGQAIAAPTLLHDQDRIKICDFRCTFHTDQETPPPLSLPARSAAAEDAESSSTIEAVVSDSNRPVLPTQSSHQLSALLEISRKLTRVMPLDQLLPEVIDCLFALFPQADRAFILLRDEKGDQLVPHLVRTRKGGETAPPRYSTRIVAQCLETGHAFLSKDAQRQFPPSELDSSIVVARMRSVMCVPLLARDTGIAFGVFQLDTQDRAKHFTAQDLELLVAVAGQVTVAIENSRLYQDKLVHDQKAHELALAREMQMRILPERLPVVPGYAFFAHYASALEVGGDYYDFIPLPDGRQAVTIADVAGKGMSAALLMVKLSSDARFCLLSEKDAEKAVGRLNALLLPLCRQTDRFVTLTLAVLDPGTQTVTLVNAGHLTPLAYRAADGTVEDAHARGAAGLPLGVQDDAAYTARAIRLGPGDGLVLFTDGVLDATDHAGISFHPERVRTVLRKGPFTPPALGERLVAAVKEHSHGCKQRDDITVVCLGKS